MPRPSRQQIDDEILETAASLFARHGFKQTSVQRIADAVGYSKTGLLHRYPTKEALQAAVIDRSVDELRAITAVVADLPPGPDRDRAALNGVAHLAMRRPGSVRLLLSGLLGEKDDDMGQTLKEVGAGVFEAFAVDPSADPARALRVIGALGALAIARIALLEGGFEGEAELVGIAFDALGHPTH
ncbi:TetR/AcrR family transcriptional regulator [Actinoplanes sp. NPDC051343]|jgi:AcrR family transcriptional regulator|uniref:TetR/AcrR family transcriptional regulator n=1 Tax=Actinoplanes sp. NPDC051343 TaxID=3363906 RepID=UPI0037BB5674